MRSTDILQSEHRLIEQVLSCLEQMAAQARAEGKLDEASAREALDFFQTFADGCHHHKEEDHLFPLMEAKGFPLLGGPTGVMRYEHEQGRRHIRAMVAALAGAGAGQAAEVRHFVDDADAYVVLRRQHIFKEDHRLFPMADRVFSAADQARLLDQFNHVEDDDLGDGTHEKYLQTADRLAKGFHVPIAPRSCGGCCHHQAFELVR